MNIKEGHFNINSLKWNGFLNALKSTLRILFPLITLPYISRIFSVENLGKYNFSLTCITYFLYLSGLGINSYGIRTGAALKNCKVSMEKFVSEIFSINLVSTIIAYIALFVFLVCFRKLDEYRKLLLILSVMIFFTTLGVEWIFSIYEDYLFITVRTILFQIISILLIFFLIKSDEDIYTYAIVTVTSSVGTGILNWLYVQKYLKIKLTLDLNLKKHLKSIITIFASDISILLYVNSDITMMGLLSNDYQMGLYSFSTKIYGGMKTMLGSFIVVVIPRLSYFWGNGDFSNYNTILKKLYENIIFFMFPFSFVIIALSSEMILIFGGNNYVNSSSSLVLLCIAFLFCELSYIYTQCILMPMHMETELMRITIFSALINICLNFFMIPLFHQNGAATTTIIAEFLVLILSRRITKKYVSFSDCKSTLIKTLFGSTLVFLLCIIIKRFLCRKSSIVVCFICFLVSIISYFFIENILENRVIIELKKHSKIKRN